MDPKTAGRFHSAPFARRICLLLAGAGALLTLAVLGTALAVAGVSTGGHGSEGLQRTELGSNVATVEGVGPISRATFNHWYRVVSKQPRRGKKKPKRPPPLDSKQGKALMKQAMEFLVSAWWIKGEAQSRGLTASGAEVTRQFKEAKRKSFSTEKAFKRYLKRTGQTVRDLRFRVKMDVLAAKIREDVLSGIRPQDQQKALDEFTIAFIARWKAVTVCRTGFVIPDCSNSASPSQPTRANRHSRSTERLTS